MVDRRLIPGGRLDAPPIGVNAFDRDDLPSGGVAIPALNYGDTPETDADRPEHPPEPGGDARVIP